MEKALVIFKPSAIQRGLIGEIIQRFERKGLQLAGIKMVQLNDEILNIHYKHLIDKPFFEWIKDSMKRCTSSYNAVELDLTVVSSVRSNLEDKRQ